MKIDAQQIMDTIIRPATTIIGLPGYDGDFLVAYTGAVESGYSTLKQDHGPALGFWQMEPASYDDNVRYLNMAKNSDLKKRLLAACYLDIFPAADALVWNLRLASTMCRVQYHRRPEPLPNYDDLEGMAKYWLKFYNGDGLGKGTIDRFVDVCKGLTIR